MEWQRTKQAAESLSLISCDQLRKFVSEGFFKEGIDYRDIRLNGRVKPNYQFHIENCKKKLGLSPSKRVAHKKVPGKKVV